MSLSTYYLNQRISLLQAEINALQSGGLPTSSNLATVLTNGNSAGTVDINMNLQDILAVNNIDLVTVNGAAYPPPSGTATNIAGGVASQIPFQSAPSVTGFIANGTSGQYLKSNGTATPSWATIPVVPATPTITQVLTAGNNALDVTQTFSATGSPTTTNIDDAEVEIIDGTSGINTKLEYDKLSLTGNYAFYNTNNVVSNTGMVINTTDTLNNFQYITNATYTDLNIQRQTLSSFITETTGTNVIDGVFYQTNDSFTSPLDNTKLSMKASSTAGTITCFNPTTATSAPLDIQTSALTINGSPITSPTPNLFDVLTAGNNALGLSITGLNNVDLVSINSTSYPPATPSWNDTLSVSNVAFQDINMNSYSINAVNNIQLNTINGLSPTTIGLNWSDFTGTNAYSNLPNNVYEVFAAGSYSRQYNYAFQVYNTSTNAYTSFDTGGMTLVDVTSGTTTSYGSNNIQNTNATAFTITAGSGASQPLNLNCSQLVINGSAYPPAIPTLRPLFYSNNSGSFSISASSWATQGTAYTFNLTPNTGYIMSVNFSLYTTTYEATGAMYLETYNSSGFFPPYTYTSSRPVAQTGNNNTFSTGGSGTSQFVFQDTINFSTDSNGQLIMDLYLGHVGGTWSGTYYWSMFANILSP